MVKYILLGLAALVLLVGAGFAFRWYYAPVRGELEQREITNRGQYRIQTYEQFYRWSEEVDAIDAKLAGYPVDLDIRQRTECQGLLARRADLVSQYNAASSAELTQGKWQAGDLPERLSHSDTRGCDA